MTTEAAHPIDLKAESKKFYSFFNLALLMAAITGIELVIIFIPFPNWIIISAIILLSAIKFFGVILWFMHLIWDRVTLFLIFISALIVATGTVAALLMLFSPGDTLPL